jgi:hypothetical protein
MLFSIQMKAMVAGMSPCHLRVSDGTGISRDETVVTVERGQTPRRALRSKSRDL